IFAAAVFVGKIHMVEIDAAVGHMGDGVGGIGQVGGFGKHLADTADAGQGHTDHDHHHGQHHQAHKQGHDVAEQAGQVTGGHAAAHNVLGTQPGNRDDAEVNRHHHGRVVESQQPFGFDEKAVQ